MDKVLLEPIDKCLTWLTYEFDLRKQKEHYERQHRLKSKL